MTMQRHFTLTATAMLLFTTAVMAQSYSPAPVFGTNGRVTVQEITAPAITHAMQPDGKLLVAGYSYNINSNSFAIEMARLDPLCGALDSSFADNGVLHHTFWQRTLCNSIALQDDGRIVGGGLVAPSNAGSQQWAGVFRFHSDGSVDSTFNGTGYRTDDLGSNTPGLVHDVFTDAQGRISAVLTGASQFGVVRFLNDGGLDSTYGVNGRAIVQHSSFVTGQGAGVLANDTITMVASVRVGSTDHVALARFDGAGVADPTFGTNGSIVHAGAGHVVYGSSSTGAKLMDIALLSDGRIVVGYAQYIGGGISPLIVAAFLPDGSVDPDFGTDGRYEHIGEGEGSGIHVLPDDRILFFHGLHWNNGLGAVFCVTPQGELDSSFGNAGVLAVPYGSQPDYTKFVDGLLLDDGSLIAHGRGMSGHFIVTRLTTDPDADALPAISFEYPDLVTTGSGAFQWYLDGEAIPGATGSSHTPATNGVYTVQMNLAECSYTSAPYTMFSVGIAEQAGTGVRIVNNPAADVLLVENPGPPVHYRVMDMRGAWQTSGQLRQGVDQLSIAALAPGMYLMAVDGDGQRSQLRFVKE